MLKTILKISLVSIWVFAVTACGAGGVGTIDPNIISTSIAQTQAARTPTGPGIPVTGNESPTPTLTVTTLPTATTAPTQTASAPTATQVIASSTSAVSTAVFTPGSTQVSVSTATNCRTGPGVGYERVGGLQAGEVADVVGRNAAGNYWIIRNPDRPSQTCWLWGQFATVSGSTESLPVFTPPAPPATATPTSAFDIAYEGLENCSSTGWWVELGLENLGGISFRSVTFTIEDRDTGANLTQRADGFINRNGCSETATRDTLGPNVSTTVSSPLLSENPTGHRLRATITLCSNLGQSGTCVTETVNMAP